jgi:hypothetical protein
MWVGQKRRGGHVFEEGGERSSFVPRIWLVTTSTVRCTCRPQTAPRVRPITTTHTRITLSWRELGPLGSAKNLIVVQALHGREGGAAMNNTRYTYRVDDQRPPVGSGHDRELDMNTAIFPCRVWLQFSNSQSWLGSLLNSVSSPSPVTQRASRISNLCTELCNA